MTGSKNKKFNVLVQFLFSSGTTEAAVDPHSDREADQEAIELTRRATIQLGWDVQWQEFLAIDDEVTIHDQTEGDWEGQLVSSFVGSKDASDELEGSDDEVPPETTPSKSGSLKEMLCLINSLIAHAIQNGDTDIMNRVMNVRDIIESKRSAVCTQQCKITDFFS